MKRALALFARIMVATCLAYSSSAHAGELIAHVTPSTGLGAIVVSTPDGSGARTLFAPPADTHHTKAFCV